MLRPLIPAASISSQLDLSHFSGFLKTQPRLFSPRGCLSSLPEKYSVILLIMFSEESFINAKTASRIISPLLKEADRYPKVIFSLSIHFVSPEGSITSTLVKWSLIAPLYDAFITSAPPTVPGIPIIPSNPDNPSLAHSERRTESFIPEDTLISEGEVSILLNPFSSSLIKASLTPLSGKSILLPSPITLYATVSPDRTFSILFKASFDKGSIQKGQLPPNAIVVCFDRSSSKNTLLPVSLHIFSILSLITHHASRSLSH